MRAVLAMALGLAAQAQPQPAPKGEFEVVSIKLGDPSDRHSHGRGTPGRQDWRNTSLSVLIRSAYGVNDYQVEGGPKWMKSARFNIEAKLPAGASRDQIPAMVQAMLADRFKLEVHRVTKILPEYQLVTARGGPKIQRAAKAGGTSSSQDGRNIQGSGLPMSTLAAMLTGAVGAEVIDKTGLEGKYDLSLEFGPLTSTPGQDDALPDIFTALREQLGLKLEKTEGPVDVLVVDHVEMPSPN